MERKRLETPAPKPKITIAANRARLSRRLRSTNRIDAASVTRPAPGSAS